MSRNRSLSLLARAVVLLAPLSLISGALAQSSSINFTPIVLSGYQEQFLTSIQFGPDGRVYVANQEGFIDILTVQRNGPGSYSVVDSERLDIIRQIPNHNDDGSPHATQIRQVTGILVLGTAVNPVIYVTSSDYRIGGAEGATDTNLDTNSGIVSRLTKVSPGVWDKVDLVRGLPRSEENHSPNGMVYDAANNRILLGIGGNTNAGAPSNNFAFLTEYAYSAAILAIDLTALEAMPVQGTGLQKYVYDLPTLDDPTRVNNPDGNDIGDPFGGNDGLNQAKIVPGSPVQIFAPGFRNPYDVVIAESGLIYTVDNGSNNGWGGTPTLAVTGDTATATNQYDPAEPGSTTPGPDGVTVVNRDTLQLIHEGYYGGHPAPVRANPSGAGLYTFDTAGVWRTSTDPTDPFPLPADWPPVTTANPVEGGYLPANEQPGAIASWNSSSNGLEEYTASNFNGAMQGNLLVVNFDNRLIRVDLNDTGDAADGAHILASNFGVIPLDVTAQGNDEPFPGTIWVACYLGDNSIVIFEPADYDGGTGLPCTGADDPTLDEDGDGYNNADEIAAGTDPCNTSDRPSDNDADFLSDVTDPDDDNDGIPDIEDPFPLDVENGANEFLPLTFELLNGTPGYGFGGVGFSGWMTDYETDYLDLYNTEQLIVGGTSGVFTINDVDQGDAWLEGNTQRNAFQFGLNVDAQSGQFYILTRLVPTNLFKPTPQDYQAAGFYIGNGDQDNYLRISAVANAGAGGIEVYYESQGVTAYQQVYPEAAVLTAGETIDLYLSIDPVSGIVLPSYAIDGGAVVTLDAVAVGSPILELLQQEPQSGWSNALAVGIIATSNPRELGAPLEETKFTADWDFITAQPHVDVLGSHAWNTLSTIGDCEARSENSVTAAGGDLILIGGRGTPPTEKLSLETFEWSAGSAPPLQLHHFQAVSYEGLVYVIGAFTGNYPTEKGTEHIYIYDPVADNWMQGREIPVDRRRGSASATLLNGKIYIAGGNINGHGQGVETTVPWFDVYDPLTNTWTPLADAPHARDHAGLVEAGGKLYFVGGRVGGDPGVFTETVAEVDVYDPATNTWEPLPAEDNLPTPRAGVSVARLGARVVVGGGESAQPAAHSEVEAYLTTTGEWETLPPLQQGRHGTGMTAVGNTLFTVAGAGNQGGGPLLNSVEMFASSADPILPAESIAAGSLVVSDPMIDFGVVESGSSAITTVSISNIGGNQGIVIQDLQLDGDAVFEIAQPYVLPFVLAPNRALVIDVTYNAQGGLAHTGNLSVNYGDGQSLSLSLQGQSDSSGTTDPGWLTMDPTSIDFGSANTGAQGSSSVVTLTNTGELTLQVDSIGISGENASSFEIQQGTLPITLAPGDSYAFVVSASPVVAGENEASVSIVHSGANSPVLVPVSITGVDTGAIRINSGGSEYIDSTGATWMADSYYVGGEVFYENSLVIENTNDPALYRRERFGGAEFSYQIPVANGIYNLELHFAEIWWGVRDNVGEDNTGQRIFTVLAEGSPIIEDLDIWAEAGHLTPLIVPVEGVQVSDGILNINVEPTVDNAKFSAIAIFPQETSSTTGLVVDQDLLDFDLVEAGEQSDLQLLLQNTSDSDITITNASISGPGAANFTAELATPKVVASGGNFPLTVNYAPTAEGASAATLHIEHSASANPISIALVGSSASGGFLEVSQSALDFGPVLLGQDASLSFQLTNSSGDVVQVSSVTITGNAPSAFSTSFTPTNIPAGESVTVNVDFAPASEGLLTAELAILNDSANSPLEVELSGQGEAQPVGSLTLDLTALNFGDVETGGSTGLQVQLTNHGNATLILQQAQITGDGATAYSHDLTEGASIEPGSSLTCTLTFAPTAEGAQNASLTITHNGDNSPSSVTLTGNGLASDPDPVTIRINAGGKGFVDTQGRLWREDEFFTGDKGVIIMPCIEIEATSEDPLYQTGRMGSDGFAYEIPVGADSYDVTLHFAEIFWGAYEEVGQDNTGKRIFSVSIEGQPILVDYDIFAIAGTSLAIQELFEDIPVTDGALSIEFSASADNAWISAIEVSNQEESGGPGETGQGILTPTPAALHFDSVPVGGSATLNISFTNTGDAPLGIEEVSFAGTDADEFSMFFIPVNIDPGDSTTFPVTYSPSTGGPASAELHLTNTTGDTPLVIPLTATTAE